MPRNRLGHRGGRAAVSVAGILGVAVVGVIASPSLAWHAAASAGPAITASPAAGLSDGQYVKVTLSGFAPGKGLAFRQCSPSPTSVAQCTATDANIIAVADASGGGSTYVPVFAGSDPLLRSSSGSGSIVCDAGHPCVIAGVTTRSDLNNAVFTPVQFGPSPELCPPPSSNAVLGGGSASAYRAIYSWESTVCQPPANLSIGYAVNNSVDGVSSFLGGLTDFAVTGPGSALPVSGAAPAPAPTFRYAPITASSVVLAYRIYDKRGPQITGLKLTPDMIAQIFEGKIANWSRNAAITALNPQYSFPPKEVPFARAEHSAQTWVFTSWLSAAAPKTWTTGPEQIFSLPPSGVQGVTGDVGIHVVEPSTDWFGFGNIGFMDSSTAAFYGLPTVEITKPDGTGGVSATPASIDKAFADAAVNPDGTLSVNYANPDASAYPMPLPTYMLAPTNTIPTSRGTQLAAFLRYAVQGGQAVLSPQSGYGVLPPNLVAESLTAADSIPAVVVKQPPLPPVPPVIARARALAPSPLLPSLPALRPVLTPATAPGCMSAATCPSAVSAATAAHRRVAPKLRADQRAELARLLAEGDATTAKYLLPGIAGFALLAVVAGAGLQLVARRRPQAH